ncbi:MAG TPA: Uma2 family endonuclease [Labilithrix sp.]|nr:Uma2 family endonuclease [Labilithrix sp.]
MAAAASLELTVPPPEQRMLLRSVSWKEYVLLRDVLDGPGVRMTYLGGILELMSPSPAHELWKTNIARLVELFAHVRGIELHGYGSTTFKSEVKQRGAEPDECYLIGKKLSDYPEIVLEVIHTTPLVDKLDVYRAFGVSEVWLFKNGTFTLHVLDETKTRYELRPNSRLVPGLDLEMVARFALREDTPQALREFDAQIRQR